MSISSHSFDLLAEEHARLLTQYAKVQRYCSELISSNNKVIEQLRAEVMRLRAQLMVRDTALAWAQEDHAALAAAQPSLPKRVQQARHIQSLMARIQVLLQERATRQYCVSQQLPSPTVTPRNSILCVGSQPSTEQSSPSPTVLSYSQFLHHDELDTDDEAALAASLHAADLVICQTGCLSHNTYWRVEDHCKRTGKQCVLVDQLKTGDLMRSISARTPALTVSYEPDHS